MDINLYGHIFTQNCKFNINPNYIKSRKYIIKWLEEYKKLDIKNIDTIIKKIIESKCNLLASYICPTLDLDKLNIINKYIVWLFIYDDTIDIEEINEKDLYEIKKIINELKTITEYELNNSNFNYFAIKIYVDLIKEIKIKLGNYYYEDFKKNILKYFETCIKEIEMTYNNTYPDPKTYIYLRRNNGGIPSLLNLLEYSNNNKFKDINIEEKKIIEILSIYSNDHTSLFNDIISLNKEKNNNYIFNIVKIYKKYENLKEYEAIKKVYYIIENISREYKKLIYKINNDDIKNYYENLNYFIVGHMKWCIESNRYINN